MDLRYENHIHEDMKYPIIFNRVAFPRHTIHPGANWHENLELMHLVAGNGAFLLGQSHVYAEAGDTLVINTNELHTIYSTEQGCVYYYLVADTCLCAELDISVSDSLFAPRIRDPFVTEQFARMIREREQQDILWQASVKAELSRLLVYLYRNYRIERTSAPGLEENRKLGLVKQAISYLSQHYLEKVTLDDLCEKMGFSKYYFCRMFREITGYSVIDYVNFLRCNHARLLLDSGEHTVSECAYLCGFCSPSYFSKQYQKHIGKLPSREGKRKRAIEIPDEIDLG